MGLILDTTFVITAERDARRGITGRAAAFLARRGAETLFITFTVAGELACGQSTSLRSDWERLCRPYPILQWTADISWHYGEIYRALAATGQLIGANDMWIAATALSHNYSVVTDNHREFRRVPGVTVDSF